MQNHQRAKSMGPDVTTWLSSLLGVVAGVVISAGFGAASLFSTGLNFGIILKPDGTPGMVINSTPAIVPGIIVLLIAALLWASRSLWWDSIAGRSSAAAVVLIAVVLGTLLFSHLYVREIGVAPLWSNVLVANSQSMLPFAFLGWTAASLIGWRGKAQQKRSLHTAD